MLKLIRCSKKSTNEYNSDYENIISSIKNMAYRLHCTYPNHNDSYKSRGAWR